MQVGMHAYEWRHTARLTVRVVMSHMWTNFDHWKLTIGYALGMSEHRSTRIRKGICWRGTQELRVVSGVGEPDGSGLWRSVHYAVHGSPKMPWLS